MSIMKKKNKESEIKIEDYIIFEEIIILNNNYENLNGETLETSYLLQSNQKQKIKNFNRKTRIHIITSSLSIILIAILCFSLLSKLFPIFVVLILTIPVIILLHVSLIVTPEKRKEKKMMLKEEYAKTKNLFLSLLLKEGLISKIYVHYNLGHVIFSYKGTLPVNLINAADFLIIPKINNKAAIDVKERIIYIPQVQFGKEYASIIEKNKEKNLSSVLIYENNDPEFQ